MICLATKTKSHQKISGPSKKKPVKVEFKTADKITEVDDIEFELGRLRMMLMTWVERVEHNGQSYEIEVDPMNRTVRIVDVTL